MSKVTRVYSHYTIKAVSLMGNLIKLKRINKKMTAQDLSDRVGISRGLLQRIEKGDPKCEIGVTFEIASLLGISLFDTSGNSLTEDIERIEDKLTVLPKAVHQSRKGVDDDF
jgi:transcriptional regulator with XRE-family HTH domain